MRANYPSTARLLRPYEFALTLKGKRLARGKLLVLIASNPNHQQQPNKPKLGIIVGKRFAPKAVTRNTIKRVLRETFRLRQHQLAPRNYIVRLHSSVGNLSLTKLKKAIRSEAETMLDKATR